MEETQVWALGWEDPLEKEMATHLNILAWRIPWTNEPGRLQSMGLQRVGHDWRDLAQLSLPIFNNIWPTKMAILCYGYGMWDIGSPTKDQTCAPCIGSAEA